MASGNRVKAAERIKIEIQEMIVNELNRGDKLPTEAELTKRFNVSRPTIREALQALEAAKIVEKRNGSAYVPEQMTDCFVDPLRIMLQLNTINQTDIFYIRRLLEREAAALAAKNATPELICQLENIVWLMQKPNITLEEYIDLDVQFHLKIAEASCNSILLQLIKDISVVLSKTYNRSCTLDLVKNSAIPFQIKTIKAIAEGDSENAREYMGRHLDESEDVIKQ